MSAAQLSKLWTWITAGWSR